MLFDNNILYRFFGPSVTERLAGSASPLAIPTCYSHSASQGESTPGWNADARFVTLLSKLRCILSETTPC